MKDAISVGERTVAEAISVEPQRHSRRRLVASGLAGLGAAGLGLARATPAHSAIEYQDTLIAQEFATKNTRGNLKISVGWSGDGQGRIELGTPGGEPYTGRTTDQVPYIDFHYAPKDGWPGTPPPPDYNSRIQNFADRKLGFYFVSPGASDNGNVVFENGGVKASQPGGTLTISNGGITAAPDLTKSTSNPLVWSGTLANGFGVQPWHPVQLFCSYRRTATDPGLGGDGYTSAYRGVSSSFTYGSKGAGVTGFGTVGAFTGQVVVENCNDDHSEQAYLSGFVRYDNDITTNPGRVNGGRAWMMDLNMHGAIGVRQGQLGGIVMFMNNYYRSTDGTTTSPTDSDSANLWVVTLPSGGGGIPRPGSHASASTYPIDSGIAIAGGSGPPASPTASPGFNIGIRIGGGRAPWGVTSSRIGKGIVIRDYETIGLEFPNRYSGSTATAIRVPPGCGEILAQGGLVTKTRAGLATNPPTDSETDNDVDGHLISSTRSRTGSTCAAGASGGTWL
jgi:hypothetical protein